MKCVEIIGKSCNEVINMIFINQYENPQKLQKMLNKWFDTSGYQFSCISDE